MFFTFLAIKILNSLLSEKWTFELFRYYGRTGQASSAERSLKIIFWKSGTLWSQYKGTMPVLTIATSKLRILSLSLSLSLYLSVSLSLSLSLSPLFILNLLKFTKL